MSAGRPGAGITIEIWSGGTLLKSVKTNADGRTDEPLLDELTAGTYELVFLVGDYFSANDGGRPFLDRVPVRFGVSEPDAHYHVPLLVTPWAYSTYRGS